jgi:putative membrane-bound dehydrogenase-like protein
MNSRTMFAQTARLTIRTGAFLGLVLTLHGAPASVRSGPEAARAQLQAMAVPDGLEVTLFACEPMVVNPADMDVDARGRVWVTEGANYRSSFQKWGVLRPEGDRIQILEDTDGDGAADKAKTFYQDLTVNAALGICVLGHRVIVSSAPYVFVLTDSDGDDVADKRELLFITDLKNADHDHSVHAFVFGPDGRLYFNFGNTGVLLRRPTAELATLPLHGRLPNDQLLACPIAKDIEGREVVANGRPFRQGMTFRCNPDGSDLEVVGFNFRNNYEVAVDSFATLWQSDNDDDGNFGVRINYLMEFGNFGYTDEVTGAGWGDAWKKAKAKGVPESEKVLSEWHQTDPGVVPNLLNTGAGSPTGICLYEGKLLPAVFQNQIIHCDAGPRVVRAYVATPEGAGYKAEIKDILTSKDDWFRPSDVCAGPDGSLYVADWNDAGVGGHYMADQKLETMTGRVYRLAPRGHKPSVPRFDLGSAPGCIEALQSPNLATRYLAWATLHDQQGKAEGALLKLWKGSDPRLRARALHLLARIKGSEQKYVSQALQDSDANLRITGLRVARALKLDVIPLVKLLAKDSSRQVRRECAIALRHNASAEAPKLWAALAAQHDGKDRWYLEALGIGADQQWDKFLDAWLAEVGNTWSTDAGRDIVWRSRSKRTPALLVKLINDPGTSPKERDRYMRSFDFMTGPEKDAALLELLTGAASGK